MQFKDLDLSAAIVASTGTKPELTSQIDGVVTFTFPDTEGVKEAVALYYTGDLYLPAKKLLRARGNLYKLLRGVK